MVSGSATGGAAVLHRDVAVACRASGNDQRGDAADLLVKPAPAVAAVGALEQRTVAQTGEELSLSGRERVDVESSGPSIACQGPEPSQR